MKYTSILFLALALAFAVHAQPASHPIGFQAAWQYDHSRSFANDAYGESKRPVLAFIWYPAAETAGRPLTYDAYFDKMLVAPERDSLLARFSEALREYSLNSFKDYSIGWHFDEWNAEAENALAELLATPSQAVEGAPPLPSGHFPVIVYHPGLGGNLLENVALCEQLAARGYIVISSSFHAQQSWMDYFYCGTLATSLEDIDFLLNTVAPAIPNAGLTKIGLMGHSFGAQAGYAYLARENNVIDAFVSLDNTFDYKTMEEIESPVYRNTSWGAINEAVTNGYRNCRATVLNLAGTQEDGATPGYGLVQRLFKTDIYLGTFPFPMLHESFLSEAALAYPLVSRYYSDSTDVAALRRDAEAYPVLVEVVAGFFDHCFQDSPFDRRLSRDGLKIRHQPPLSLPSKDSILNLYANHGLDALQARYRQFQDVSPRARMNVYPVLAHMAENGETENKIAFLEFLLGFHPEDWRLLRQAADSYLELRADKEAHAYYQRALQFCDDGEVRAEIREKLGQADK